MRSLVAIAGFFVLFGAGCASVKTKDLKDEGPRTVSDILRQDPPVAKVGPQGEIYVRGIKLENTQFDIPITINSRVEYWIDYFQGRGRKHFARYLERSELFIPYIVPLLRQNGMPEDLVYLAMIESGFNNHARSRAKAVGPWQFISATGKRYGLMVNWWVDERRDTRKSTLAAVEYLRDLYNMFQAWELAAAAYNAGEAKIARAIRRFGTKDFWVISRHRFLRPETRDYVPKIIAAALIAKNRTQFGFPASTLHPGDGEAVSGDGEVVKLEKESEAERQPTPGATSTDASDTIASVLKADELDDYEDAPDERTVDLAAGTNGAGTTEPLPLARPVPTPHVTKKGEVGGEELAEFEVQSPADLLKVARAAGLSYHTVKALNPELLRWCTPPTVNSYRIKLPASAKEKFLATYNHDSYPRKVQFLTYKVRRGDTLARIAGHFGIKVDPITDLNGVSPRVPLRSGVRVLLPMPNDRSRTLASLEVRDPPERRRYRRSRPKSSSKTFKVSFKKRGAARARPPKT
jgi:membrane-bound lytic murein transglycosylase D